MTVDASGNILIADSDDGRVRCIPGSSRTFYGQAMTAGDIYTVAGNEKGGYSGDGGPATSAGQEPTGLTLDAHGNLVIADTANFRVRVVAAATGTFYGHAMKAGDIYTVAGNGIPGFSGDGGPAIKAEFAAVGSVAIGPAGNILVGDLLRIRSISP